MPERLLPGFRTRKDPADAWRWQDGWAPRVDPTFNAGLVDRWFDKKLGNLDWAVLLDDPRWDPAVRWIPGGTCSVASCGWEIELMDAPGVSPQRWFERIGDAEALSRRWTLFPSRSEPAEASMRRTVMTSCLLQALIGMDVPDHPVRGPVEPSQDPMDRRCRLVRALGAAGVALGQETPDPDRPGWFNAQDSARVGLLALAAQKGAGHRLASALLDVGLSVAVRHASGLTDVEELLDLVGKLPASNEVREHWPALLERALRTVPPGPEWAAWREHPRRGIMKRCVINAAVAVETRALRQELAVLDPVSNPARGRARL